MSIALTPFGLRPVFHPSGLIKPRALKDGIASAYGTAIFKGAPVAFSNSTGTLTAVGSAADICGIFSGVEYTPAGGGRRVLSPYWPAGATFDVGTCMAYFWSDPELRYEVQADGSIAQAGSPAGIGAEADLTNWTNGSVYTGISGVTLASALKASGTQGMFRIVDLSLAVDNAWGDAFTKVIVSIARHQFTAAKVSI